MSKTDGALAHKDMVLESKDFTNPRSVIEKRGINELAENIAVHGLMQPLQVWQKKEGGKTVNVIINGGRRWRAIGQLISDRRANGLNKSVPVRFVTPTDLADADLKALSANIQNKLLTSYEITEGMARLLKRGVKQKDIATKISKSATWVSRQLKAYAKATPQLKKAWEKGLPVDDVQTLAALSGTEQVKRLDQLMALRDTTTEKKAPRKDRAKARQIAKGEEKAKGKEKNDRELRQSKDRLEELLEHAQGSKDQYVLGVRDALLFSLGRIGHGSFATPLRKHMAAGGFKSDKKEDRADDNRKGKNGRGPKDHQTKVDAKKTKKKGAKKSKPATKEQTATKKAAKK